MVIEPGGYYQGVVALPLQDYDVNGDLQTDIADVGKLGLRWGWTGVPGWIREDVNKDGSIDIGDVGRIGLHGMWSYGYYAGPWT
ncbi:MAG: hypothetical protein ACUVX9_18350 [Anaerolineae bacterium]